MSSAQAVPYLMKSDFISVVVNGRPFQLVPSHPTFKQMAAALKAKSWGKIPKLVSLAEQISSYTHGGVKITKGVVFYKGREVESVLTKRMLELIDHGQPVAALLKFMDCLYQNPQPEAIAEFYEWLMDNELPIYDDGCFAAYKYVRDDYTDTHTGTVLNTPGEVPLMSRNLADKDWRTQCSSGYHVCSKKYGKYGSKCMKVKIHPRDVLSANGGKMRVVRYEVMSELGSKDEIEFTSEGYAELEGKGVLAISKERRDLIKALTTLPTVKRLLRNKKLTAKSFRKASHARLQGWLKKFGEILPPEKSKLFDNPLRPARVAAKLTTSQVATAMNITTAEAYNLERKKDPTQDELDSYLEALTVLTGATGVAYPVPVAPLPVKVYTPVPEPEEEDEPDDSTSPSDDEFDGYEEEEEDEDWD